MIYAVEPFWVDCGSAWGLGVVGELGVTIWLLAYVKVAYQARLKVRPQEAWKIKKWTHNHVSRIVITCISLDCEGSAYDNNNNNNNYYYYSTVGL